jgi:thioredoxin 1
MAEQLNQSKLIITSFPSRNDFLQLLKKNPGLVILKLGATWCGPCKVIKPMVDTFFATSPPNVICADIDVDESFDLYALFKSKRIVNGIPVVLVYKKGNETIYPDERVTGADQLQLHNLFLKCGNFIKELS